MTTKQIFAQVPLCSTFSAMYELGSLLGLSGKALSTFAREFSPLMLGVEVNPETGKATILKVDGLAVVQLNDWAEMQHSRNELLKEIDRQKRRADLAVEACDQAREAMYKAAAERDRLADLPICRLQLPDGTVPSGTEEALTQWHRIATENAKPADEIDRPVLCPQCSHENDCETFHRPPICREVPLIECRGCSEAGGADRAVYHDAPPCRTGATQ